MEHLTSIMNRNGSDKGSGHHNYTEIYAGIFDARREQVLTVLEIGIGTVNPGIPSSMCGTPGGYNPGASLRGWRDYFVNSQIYGCDIDRDILINDDRITTFYLDQTSRESIKTQIVDVDRTYDVIVDDGLHHFRTNWDVFHQIHNKLNSGGVYIIEDIVDFDKGLFEDSLRAKLISEGYVCEFVPIPNPRNTSDNNIVLVKKP